MANKNIFLTLLLLGLIGRWIVVPAIKRMEAVNQINKIDQISDIQFECIKKTSYTAIELTNPFFLEASRIGLTREYLRNYGEGLYSQDAFNTSFLRGLTAKKTTNENDQEFINSLSENDLKSFILGLYQCSNSECRDFTTTNLATLENKIDPRSRLLLKIKSDEPWSIKNKYVEEFLFLVEKDEAYSMMIFLVEYIPNHPRLRKYLEKYYLKIIGQKNIDKAAVHLSRYNSGWHDRKYVEILSSKNLAHIDSFIQTMRIDCPRKAEKIYQVVNGLSKQTQQLAIEEAYYILGPTDKLAKELKLDSLKFIEDSKCHRPIDTI